MSNIKLKDDEEAWLRSVFSKKDEDRVIIPPPHPVGMFSITPLEPEGLGILESIRFKKRFNPYVITWVVSHRPDKRHGVVSPTVPTSNYAHELYKAVMRKW